MKKISRLKITRLKRQPNKYSRQAKKARLKQENRHDATPA